MVHPIFKYLHSLSTQVSGAISPKFWSLPWPTLDLDKKKVLVCFRGSHVVRRNFRFQLLLPHDSGFRLNYSTTHGENKAQHPNRGWIRYFNGRVASKGKWGEFCRPWDIIKTYPTTVCVNWNVGGCCDIRRQTLCGLSAERRPKIPKSIVQWSRKITGENPGPVPRIRRACAHESPSITKKGLTGKILAYPHIDMSK